MTRWTKFDLEVKRSVDLDVTVWPDNAEVRGDGWLSGNRCYYDLTDLSWSEMDRVFDLEAEALERLGAASDPAEEEGSIDDEMYEEGVLLHGLDVGVASCVVALSAAGCVPFSSCNGGAFGRSHHEVYPLVALYASKPVIPLLLECAEAIGTGLVNGDEGELILHADTIEAMVAFAQTVRSSATRFDELKEQNMKIGRAL